MTPPEIHETDEFGIWADALPSRALATVACLVMAALIVAGGVVALNF